jgi:hypothetical protein
MITKNMTKAETRELIKAIESDWSDLEDDMGEFAALEVACQMNGIDDSQWYYDNQVEMGSYKENTLK